jgi:hypothetical protein
MLGAWLFGLQLPMWAIWSLPLAGSGCLAAVLFWVVFRASARKRRPAFQAIHLTPLPSLAESPIEDLSPIAVSASKYQHRDALGGGAVSLETTPLPQQAVRNRMGERRSSLRRGDNPIAVKVSDAKAELEPYPGWVVDRSRNGLSLLVPKASEVGSIISVCSTLYPDFAPWVQVKVRRCLPKDNQWLIGCQFTRSLPWNVLLLFG